MAKYGGLLGSFLGQVGEATGYFSWPLEYTEAWRRKQLGRTYKKQLYNTYDHAKRKGLVRVISKNGKKFLLLTEKGQLEMLLIKARLPKPNKWDGKWRIAVFDIPEEARDRRNRLRNLLKQNNYIKLQNSVFINPYPLNREAISYLKKTGLISYIRLIKAEEIDDDRDLKKKFGLK